MKRLKRFNIIIFLNKYFYFHKYLAIILFIIYLFGLYLNSPKMKIFTFWEPIKNIPGYLQLCIKTWKKFLPEYEIKILDYKGVKEYLGESLFDSIIYKNMSLQIQSDAIRVAILQKYGGIWMDVDTIITNRKFLNELKKNKSELVMIGDEKCKIQHIGFIFASANSTILTEWLNQIIININNAKQTNNMTKKLETLTLWNYLGNGIIDPLVRNTSSTKFFRLDKYKLNVFPELKFFGNSTLNVIDKYIKFYFRKGKPEQILNDIKGIIMLHNSWTPNNFKSMSKKEFLEKDIFLSKLFKIILKRYI